MANYHTVLDAGRDKGGSFNSVLPLTVEVPLAEAFQETLTPNGEIEMKSSSALPWVPGAADQVTCPHISLQVLLATFHR